MLKTIWSAHISAMKLRNTNNHFSNNVLLQGTASSKNYFQFIHIRDLQSKYTNHWCILLLLNVDRVKMK